MISYLLMDNGADVKMTQHYLIRTKGVVSGVMVCSLFTVVWSGEMR